MSTTTREIVSAHDLKFRILYTEEEIQSRVKELGAAITQKYKNKKPIFVSILNGAFIFTADLVRACDLDCEITFTKLSSYSGLESTGKVDTVIGLDMDLKGRDIIVVEDIVDTGVTLYEFMQVLKKMEPASVSLAAFLVKPDAMKYQYDIDFVGYEIPNKFVIGYGLDYDQLARNYGAIYQLITED